MSVSNGGATAGRRTTAPTARGRKPAVVWPYMRVRGANGADALNRGRCESPDWDWFRASSNDDDASVLERATEVELRADDARSGSWVGGARIVEPQPDGTPRPMLRGSMPLRLAFTLVTAVDTVRGERERDVTVSALYSVPGSTANKLVEVRAEAPRLATRVFGAVPRLPTNHRVNAATNDVERWSAKTLAWIPCGRVVDGVPMRAVRLGNVKVFAAYAADTATRYAGPRLFPGTATPQPDAQSVDVATAYAAMVDAAVKALRTGAACDRAVEAANTAPSIDAAYALVTAWQRHNHAESVFRDAAAVWQRALWAREAPTVVPRGGSALEAAPRTYVTPIGPRVTEPAAPDERTLRANPRIPAMAPSALRAALDPEAVAASVRADAALAAERRAKDAATAAKVAAKRAGKKRTTPAQPAVDVIVRR